MKFIVQNGDRYWRWMQCGYAEDDKDNLHSADARFSVANDDAEPDVVEVWMQHMALSEEYVSSPGRFIEFSKADFSKLVDELVKFRDALENR